MGQFSFMLRSTFHTEPQPRYALRRKPVRTVAELCSAGQTEGRSSREAFGWVRSLFFVLLTQRTSTARSMSGQARPGHRPPKRREAIHRSFF